MATSSTSAAGRPTPIAERIAAHPFASGTPRVGWQGTLTTFVVLIVVGWAWVGTKASPVELVASAPNMADFIRRMFLPDWGFFLDRQWVIEPTIATIQIAITGTAVATLLAFPLSLIAARNLSHPAIYQSVRAVLNVLRSIPELIWALIFVSAVGMGPFAGILALALPDIGLLGKIFSEALEAADKRQQDAIRAVGGSRLATVRFGLLPQAAPVMLAQVLYVFESNTRSATILGVVGAGGIGLQLADRIRINNWDEAAFILLLILGTVIAIDAASRAIRLRLIRP